MIRVGIFAAPPSLLQEKYSSAQGRNSINLLYEAAMSPYTPFRFLLEQWWFPSSGTFTNLLRNKFVVKTEGNSVDRKKFLRNSKPLSLRKGISMNQNLSSPSEYEGAPPRNKNEFQREYCNKIEPIA